MRLRTIAVIILFVPGIASAFTFTRSLSVGSSGTDVAALQQFLFTKGYLAVKPTGYYGGLTKYAVQYFQDINHLEQTGSVGPKTRSLLNSLATNIAAPKITIATPTS